MSTFLNGADVIIGKVYKGSGVTFSAGDIYRSSSSGKTYRFCVIDPTLNDIVVCGQALSGEPIGGETASKPTSSKETTTFHGVAIIDKGGATCTPNALTMANNGLKVGIWAQLGGALDSTYVFAHDNIAPFTNAGATVGLGAGASLAEQSTGQTGTSAFGARILGANHAAVSNSAVRGFAFKNASKLANTVDWNWWAVNSALVGVSTSGALVAGVKLGTANTLSAITDGNDTYGYFCPAPTIPSTAHLMITGYDEVNSTQPTDQTGSTDTARGANAAIENISTFSEIVSQTTAEIVLSAD